MGEQHEASEFDYLHDVLAVLSDIRDDLHAIRNALEETTV